MLLGILYSLYSSARWRDINRRLKEENCNLSLILFSGSINISGVPNSPHQVVLLASLFQELYDARTESNRIRKTKVVGLTALKTHNQPFNKADGASGAGSGGNPCRFLLLHHLKNVSGWPANCLCSTNVFGFSLSLSIYRGKKGA